MENFELQERLRALAAGELTPEEIAALRTEAAQSPEMAQELHFSQKLAQALQHKELLEVNGIIGGIILSEGLPPTAFARKGWNWNGFLLSLLLLGVFSTGIYLVGNQLHWWQSQEEKLVLQYLQPLENVLFTEQTSMAANDLRLGMDAYDQKDYRSAIPRLETYYTRTQDANVGLFLSISYLLEKRTASALSILISIVPILEGPAQEAAQWYLALAHLQTGESERTTAILKTIPADGLYGASAQELSQQLN